MSKPDILKSEIMRKKRLRKKLKRQSILKWRMSVYHTKTDMTKLRKRYAEYKKFKRGQEKIGVLKRFTKFISNLWPKILKRKQV